MVGAIDGTAFRSECFLNLGLHRREQQVLVVVGQLSFENVWDPRVL
jgi:hypothetical protein